MSKYSELADRLEDAPTVGVVEMELHDTAAAALRELEAVRMAYAWEFPLNEDGEPDVGSIHQNIRALKAERDRLRDLVRIAYGVWPDVPDEAWLDAADAALESKP